MKARVRASLVVATLVATVFARMLYGQETNATTEVYPAGVLCAWSTNHVQRLFLPLKQTDVSIDMVSGIVTATVRQRFVNDTAFPLEAMYIFPLPPDAAITDMEMRVGDRLIRSVVQEKAEAKKTYEAAKAAGKKTALLEASRPNVFETSLANFLPGETVDIQIAYTQVSELRKGVYDVTFPMVVGQRYYPAPQPQGATATVAATGVENAPENDAVHVNPPVLHPAIDCGHRLSLSLDIQGLPVKTIISNTHRIDVTPIANTPNGRRVVLHDTVTIPNSDFNVQISLQGKDDIETSFMAAEHAGALHGLLTVFPPAQDSVTNWVSPARDVVFLVDTSGSMDGDSIGQAKAGLKRCLGMLRPEDCFTIVRFSSDFSSFTPDLRPATPSRVEAGREYVSSLVADGGTEMQKALRHVLDLIADSEKVPMIVFLTDGCVGNEDSLMALLASSLGRGRLFSFGIGSAPNALLLQKVAEIGRGESRFIRSHEDVGRVMSDFFETLATPMLTDIRIKWLDEAGDVVNGHECYPSPCPDIFAGRPLQVVGRFPGLISGVEVHGMMNGEAQQFRRTFSPSESLHPSVARLFGKRRVDELMFRMLRPKTPEARIDLRREALMTALSYQLVTTQTSRVAVEEKVSRLDDGSLHSIRVPVAAPKGWNMFSATATQDMALLLVGMASLLTLWVLRWGRRYTA
jgi:Ca-activated chloride channel homolog